MYFKKLTNYQNFLTPHEKIFCGAKQTLEHENNMFYLKKNSKLLKIQ